MTLRYNDIQTMLIYILDHLTGYFYYPTVLLLC